MPKRKNIYITRGYPLHLRKGLCKHGFNYFAHIVNVCICDITNKKHKKKGR